MGANMEFFLAHMMLPIAGYVPDIDTLQSVATRIIIGIGETTPKEQLAYRAVVTLAQRLRTNAVLFPGDHGGVHAEPVRFAETVHKALGAS